MRIAEENWRVLASLLPTGTLRIDANQNVSTMLANILNASAEDHIVRPVNSVSRCTRSSKLSNLTFPCNERSIRGIRLHKLLRKSRVNDRSNWRNGLACEHRFKTERSQRPACQKPTGLDTGAEERLRQYLDSFRIGRRESNNRVP